MNRKIMFACILLGICLLLPIEEAAAVKIIDVDYILGPYGSRSTSYFNAQSYDILLIKIYSTDIIDIQVRTVGETMIRLWSSQQGAIELSCSLPEDGLYTVYFANPEDIELTITGALYLNGIGDTTTTTTTTTSTRPRYIIDVYAIINGFFVMLGIILLALIMLVLKKRRDNDVRYLINIDDDELLPKGWDTGEDET